MTTEEKVVTTPESSETVEVVDQTPAELPFDPRPKNVDALMQSTARFSRKGWDVFLALKEDLEKITYKRIELRMVARSEAGAKTFAEALEAISVPAVKVNGVNISTITTFAKLQDVIKHPDLLSVDLTLLD
ncbi:MAG: hypothetical protein ACK551_00645 [Vampirovibrionales bacterium]